MINNVKNGVIDIKEVVTSNEIEFKCGFLWQNPPDKPNDTIFQDEEKSKVDFTTCWVKCVNIEVEDELCYLKC